MFREYINGILESYINQEDYHFDLEIEGCIAIVNEKKKYKLVFIHKNEGNIALKQEHVIYTPKEYFELLESGVNSYLSTYFCLSSEKNELLLLIKKAQYETNKKENGITTLVFYGSIIIAILISLFFIYWVWYKLVFEKKIDKFVRKYSAPKAKQRYLAGASLYSSDPYSARICLKSFYLSKARNQEKQKKVFIRDWSIKDHNSAIEILEWLLNSGHREQANYASYLNQLNARSVTDANLSKLISDACQIEVLDDNNEYRRISENAIYNCQGIDA